MPEGRSCHCLYFMTLLRVRILSVWEDDCTLISSLSTFLASQQFLPCFLSTGFSARTPLAPPQFSDKRVFIPLVSLRLPLSETSPLSSQMELNLFLPLLCPQRLAFPRTPNKFILCKVNILDLMSQDTGQEFLPNGVCFLWTEESSFQLRHLPP